MQGVEGSLRLLDGEGAATTASSFQSQKTPAVNPQIIFDMNNWLRRRFEAGAGVRTCFAEIKAWPGACVFDGAYALDRRRKIFPGYKLSRTPASSDIYAQFELMRELLAFAPVPVIRVPTYEADDVIATLARITAGPVHIKSTDCDFLQLPNVTLDRDRPFPVPAHRVRVFKASVGDRSDNIPGLKMFGHGSWKKMSEDDIDQLEDFLSGANSRYPENLPTATFNWLDDDPENVAAVRGYYKITALFDVPMEEIAAGTVMGTDRPDLAEQIFREFLL